MFELSRRTLLAGGAAAALSAPMARAAPADLVWGVNGHPFTAYPGISFADQLDLVRDLGMTSYRVNGAEPDTLETLLPLAEARGITLLPIIEAPLDMKTEPLKEIRAQCYERGRRMARHFRGRIPAWELGNELENFAIIQPCEMNDAGEKYPCEWGPAGGVDRLEYVGARWARVSAVLSGLSRGVAAGDRKALRAMGTAGWGHLGAFDRMAEDRIAWDITVWHDYQGVTEPYLDKLAGFGKPIWITEFNARAGGEASPEENARALVERIAYYRRMRERYRVEAAHVYELFDEVYWGDTFEARMGLYGLVPGEGGSWRIGAPKPAADAVRTAIKGG